jgi:hypothetical protein
MRRLTFLLAIIAMATPVLSQNTPTDSPNL